LHLFLIPLKRASGDSQMIFVHAEHTPFAAGAKRRTGPKNSSDSVKKREWDAALRRVGSDLVCGTNALKCMARRRAWRCTSNQRKGTCV